MAIVVDDVYSIAGLVTLEDVLEIIVGEISETGDVDFDAEAYREKMKSEISIQGDWCGRTGFPVNGSWSADFLFAWEKEAASRHKHQANNMCSDQQACFVDLFF